MTMIVRNLQLVRDRITTACVAAGRDPASVRLLAVSKTFGVDAVIEAMSDGQRAFGENYIQEGVEKILAVRKWETEVPPASRHSSGLIRPDARPANAEPGWPDQASAYAVARAEALRSGASSPQAGPLSSPAEWHCIGPVQSNKTRLVAEHFDWVQSVDRLKIAQRLSEQRPSHLPPLQVCLQVNIDGGSTKSGVVPQEAQALALEVARLPRLQLRGLMSIPEPAADFLTACAVHRRAAVLFEQINQSGVLPQAMDTLSMGMTADLEAAIHAGSMMVRVGTAIFGAR